MSATIESGAGSAALGFYAALKLCIRIGIDPQQFFDAVRRECEVDIRRNQGMNSPTETTTFARSKFGLIHDPRGAHVVLPWQGRELLGEVIGCRYDDVTGCTRLTVRHFNGEAWPIDPAASAVRVLIRRT